MKKEYWIFLLAITALRLAVSLAISDGRLKSDAMTYLGIVVNVEKNFDFSAIQPPDSVQFTDGATVDSLSRYLRQLPAKPTHSMNYQWLHSVVYLPLLLLFPSLYAIIVMNNILFMAAGYFFFKPFLFSCSRALIFCGWCLYAFFPPFFYLTGQFFSEPIFLLFLSVIAWNQLTKPRSSILSWITAVGICLTRYFGIVAVFFFILSKLIQRQYRESVILCCAVILAWWINLGVQHLSLQKNAAPSHYAVVHYLYFTNTTTGNGDFDYFMQYPEKIERDTMLAGYGKGKRSLGDIVAELVRQNVRHAGTAVENSLNKASEYFLHIIPDSWIYPPHPLQPLWKKFLWGVQNLLLLGMIFYGMYRSESAYKIYFSLFFLYSFLFHFFILARYRYLLPVLAMGIPYAMWTLKTIFPSRWKKDSLIV